MLDIKRYRFYFCPCTQDLYGDEVLRHVAEHSAEVVAALNASDKVPYEVVLKPNLLTSDVIQATFNEANADPDCAGIITWAHTFSPSKNYIAGLHDLRKPLCQFATQYNEEIPYDSIDMDFMNASNTSSAPNTTSHSSNVKTEVKSSSTSKKEKKITAKAVDESSVVAESSSVDSNNNNSVSTNSNVQTATNQVASANSSVAKESSSVATGNNNVTENAVAPSVTAESSQKVQEVNQQLTPAQIAALAAYYMGNDANSLTVHNMGNYNAVSGADGQLLFAYSADGNNLKVGGFGDTPWDSVNANDVMQKAQQQGNKDSINQVANNTTFEKGY